MKYLRIPILFLCLFSFAVGAEVTDFTQNAINVEMVPSIPGANQSIRVDLTSYTTDINSAKITWLVNGKQIKSGVGEKLAYFTTGNMGETTKLEINILTREGENINRIINIRPSEVDLSWQAESYTPPFYKGKAMFAHQNKITFIATPHITNSAGQEIDPRNLIYKWTVNSSVIDSASGYGKSSYTHQGSIISRTLDVTVQVTVPDGVGGAVSYISVKPVKPSIIIYEKNPVHGIQLQKALTGTIDLKNAKEITVIGAPYFFSLTSPQSPDLVYKWSINGASLKNAPNENIQVFRPKEGSGGIAKISLSIENTEKILQTASEYFNLSFKNEETASNPSF